MPNTTAKTTTTAGFPVVKDCVMLDVTSFMYTPSYTVSLKEQVELGQLPDLTKAPLRSSGMNSELLPISAVQERLSCCSLKLLQYEVRM